MYKSGHATHGAKRVLLFFNLVKTLNLKKKNTIKTH